MFGDEREGGREGGRGEVGRGGGGGEVGRWGGRREEWGGGVPSPRPAIPSTNFKKKPKKFFGYFSVFF